ncbi:MAG: DNA topoisomerase [Eubacteriales bacterium]|nr:DNA topoisomerase [Eubacteriales bacterium]
MKKLFIAEKPSVARTFAEVLTSSSTRKDGWLAGDDCIFTWCVGHLVAMSYPDAYSPSLKRWSMEALPFVPVQWRYEIIDRVKKQYETVRQWMHHEDVDVIYVCTDAGREGEYIYRLLEEQSGIPDKKRLRVWIDAQTSEEIRRGVANAKPLTDYDNLAASAYLRAKEDYLMGINFSRLLTISYGETLARELKKRHFVIAVGRVMTCVLGMVVQREREIRTFQVTPFYRLQGLFQVGDEVLESEWKVCPDSAYANHPLLYKENGLTDKKEAESFAERLQSIGEGRVLSREKKKSRRAAPLLFNLAELQNECAKTFKISPDETLRYAQELYEKKMISYPRTDARVLSRAVAKEIDKPLRKLSSFPKYGALAAQILSDGAEKKLARSKYVNDAKVTDHYALIPTGEGLNMFDGLSRQAKQIYGKILLRFLAIFYPAAEYEHQTIVIGVKTETFIAKEKRLVRPGWMAVNALPEKEKSTAKVVPSVRKGQVLPINDITVRAGETTPPKRYTTGSIILAMENAGSLIEDEDLRAQIKGSGIGTSATRAEIIKKLLTNAYIGVNKKTQVITPTMAGECIYQVVANTIPGLLDPKLTASWEKGLGMVADGVIDTEAYMEKLTAFVQDKVNVVKYGKLNYNIQSDLRKIEAIYRHKSS